MDLHKKDWEESYERKENFLFYPNEEVIRFASKYVRKQIGLKEFRPIYQGNPNPRVLDVGCGIGRHQIFFQRMGLDSFGIDLSEKAVSLARKWAESEGLAPGKAAERILAGNVTELPWGDGYFDVLVSHGVLDSMQFEVAQRAVAEAFRVTAPGGYFYCDLISGDDSEHSREFAAEETVKTVHEQGTVQSYFNFDKIKQLFSGTFELIEPILIRMDNVQSGSFMSRYHLTLRKNLK